MSYSSTNPARKILDTGIVSGSGMYIYESTHNSTQIVATGFFTDAGVGGPGSIGMKVGDLLANVNTSSNGISWHRVTSLSTSTGWESGIDATVGAGST